MELDDDRQYVNTSLGAGSSEWFEAELVVTASQSPARIVASIQNCSRLGWPTAVFVLAASVSVSLRSM